MSTVNLCLDILDISKHNVYIFWNMPYGSTSWMTESRIQTWFWRRHLLSLAQYSTQVAQMLIHTFFSHPTCRLKLTMVRVKDSWRHNWLTTTDTGCTNTGSTGVGISTAAFKHLGIRHANTWDNLRLRWTDRLLIPSLSSNPQVLGPNIAANPHAVQKPSASASVRVLLREHI